MAAEKNYYTVDPLGKLRCVKCGVPLEKGKAKPEELALGKVASVERALEDK